MTDASTPLPFTDRLAEALDEGDAEALRAVAAEATSRRDLIRTLTLAIEGDAEAIAPGLLTDLFERALTTNLDEGRDDRPLQQVIRQARAPALTAATRAHAAGDRRPLTTRLAMEAAAPASNAAAVEIGLALLATRPITHHHLVAAKQLRVLGAREPVLAWIEAVERSNDLDDADERLATAFRQFVDHAPRDAEADSVVLIREKPGARRVVFAFFGLSNRFGVSLEQLETWMAPLDAHLVMLKDPELLIYLKGIAALGPNLRATADGLREIAARLGADEILCMGTSAGGFAAIRYGLLTGASRVLGFGALTILTAERTERRADGRAPGLAERLLGEVREELGDCRVWLGERTLPMPLDLYYGDAMPNDTFHARHLEGLPGVTLHPIHGLDVHGAVRDLDRKGDMPAILAAFVEGRPLPDVD